MKIAIAGFMHESNTFSSTRTDRAAFESASFKSRPIASNQPREGVRRTPTSLRGELHGLAG